MVCCLSADFSRTSVPISARTDEAIEVIGKVLFTTHRGEPAEAILSLDGTWHCPQLPILDRVLNILHAPKRTDGQPGAFGQAELEKVAAWFQGRVKLGDLAPRDPMSPP
jgi:hypothetical protein